MSQYIRITRTTIVLVKDEDNLSDEIYLAQAQEANNTLYSDVVTDLIEIDDDNKIFVLRANI